MKKQSLKTYIELLEKDRDEMILNIEGLEYGIKKSKEAFNWSQNSLKAVTDELKETQDEIARLQGFMDGIDRQAQELDEKDRTIRDLEEQISNLKAAVAPKPKAPQYAPGYERKGGK